MIGTRLAHYDITAMLGKGGMGEVYRARDTRLGREVAIKVLPAEVAADPQRLERFRREARALAALDHPGVVTVYSVEDAGDVHFLTMELVRGRGLDELSPGALPVSQLLDLSAQIVDALGAAHERGIIHRDLKPANIMLTVDGRVKLLDFGLARLDAEGREEGETSVQTQAGVIMGTAAYMSPEQAQGKVLDHRSDIFSLGAVLYELGTGRRPFTGDNVAALVSAVLRDEPPSASSINKQLPARLSEIIRDCLSKDPARRPQTADQLGEWLRAMVDAGGGPPAPRAKSIVVLPFANRSPDPDNEYFADGLTEEIISDLAHVSELRVISRNSAMTLKGTRKDTATLAGELGVSHVLSGSVRRAGDALRVTAELIDARTDAPIWSDKFSGTIEDVFGIQEEISRKIVAALQVRLTDTEEIQVAERPIENPVAYDCYLRARQEMYVWTGEASQRAKRLVDDALAIVGDNALLFAIKGQLLWNDVNIQLEPNRDEGLDRALHYADRALALDAGSHLGVYVQGLVAGLRGEAERALELLYRAHALVPGDANVIAELCRFANAAGLRHHGELVDRLVQIDPLTPLTPLVISTYRSTSGQHDLAAAAARRAIEMAPEYSMLHMLGAWQIAESGAHDEAAQILARCDEDMADTALGRQSRFLRAALQDDREGARGEATADLIPFGGDHIGHAMAAGNALLGFRDDAVRWTQQAIRAGFVNYPCLAEYDPFLASLRDDPEYRGLMQGIEPRWRALVEWEERRR